MTAKFTRDEVVGGLLRGKLRELLQWQVPEIVEAVGPFNSSVFEGYELRRLQVVRNCQGWLAERTDLELNELVENRQNRENAIVKQWTNLNVNDIRDLKATEPQWYDGGFGHPDYRADFEYWCKMPAFSVEEALHLSIGIEPETFPKRSLASMGKSPATRIDGTLGFLMYRYKLLQRQFDSQDFGWKVQPKDFLDWSGRVQFETHPEFTRLLKLFHDPSTAPDARGARPDRPDKREIDKIAQLFTAMAIDSLGYVPGASRSPIPREIADFAATMGLQVSEDTVRKYLKLGASFLPDEWNQNNL